jgi:hypothetical protein
LQKGKETVSAIVFRDVSHSLPRIELLHHCQKFFFDSILLLSPHVVQSDVSPDAFTRFMEILGGAERPFSPEISDDLMLLAREFGHNRLITHLIPQRDFPRRERTHTNYYKNSTGAPEVQQSKLNSSLFATASPMCNAAYP